MAPGDLFRKTSHHSLFVEGPEYTISRKPVGSNTSENVDQQPFQEYHDIEMLSPPAQGHGSRPGPQNSTGHARSTSDVSHMGEISFDAPPTPYAPGLPRSYSQETLSRIKKRYEVIEMGERAIEHLNESSTTLGSQKRSPTSTSKSGWSCFRPGNDWWLWELLSCLLSFLSAAAIIIALKLYDDQPLPNWPHSITLNSFLALFTTLAKAGLMIPITEALSQLKWIWFREQERPLIDFETFDQASRGPIGGAKLLGTLKGRHLASWGAIISILGIATSPITQQLISYPTRMVPSELHSGALATAPRSDFWMGYVPMRASSGVPDLPMKQAIQNGLYNAVNESILATTPMCSTGNCTWPLYSSLSVCALVNDVSSLLTKTPVPGNVSAMIGGVTDYNVTLPNGAYLLAGQFVLNITTLPSIDARGFSVPLSNHTLSFANEPHIENTTVVNSFVIYRKNINTASETFGAIEILLRWCVNTYNSSTVAGTPTTSIASTSNSVLTANGTTLQLVNGTWSNSSGTGWEMYNQTRYGQLVLPSSNSADKSNYTVDGAANYALTGFMKSVFKGTYITGFGSTYSTDTAMSLSNALWNAPYTANTSGTLTESDQDKMQLEGVRSATNNIAVSMTNNLRTRPFWGSPSTGTPYNLQSYVHVQWGWLTFLLVLLASSFAFLLATIIKSKRANVDIIRSSALAAMCGLSEESKGFMGPIELNGREGTLEKAGNLRVRLVGREKRGVGMGRVWTLKSEG